MDLYGGGVTVDDDQLLGGGSGEAGHGGDIDGDAACINLSITAPRPTLADLDGVTSDVATTPVAPVAPVAVALDGGIRRTGKIDDFLKGLDVDGGPSL